MPEHQQISRENPSRAVAQARPRTKRRSLTTSAFQDKRPEAVAHAKLRAMADNSPQAKATAQLQALAYTHDSGTHGGLDRERSSRKTASTSKTSVPNAHNDVKQFTVAEAVDIAKELFPAIADRINSWSDIDRFKLYFTPEQRALIRRAANNNQNGGATVRATWVAVDTPETNLPPSEAEIKSMVETVTNAIRRIAEEKGPEFVTKQLLRQIPGVGNTPNGVSYSLDH